MGNICKRFRIKSKVTPMPYSNKQSEGDISLDSKNFFSNSQRPSPINNSEIYSKKNEDDSILSGLNGNQFQNPKLSDQVSLDQENFYSENSFNNNILDCERKERNSVNY